MEKGVVTSPAERGEPDHDLRTPEDAGIFDDPAWNDPAFERDAGETGLTEPELARIRADLDEKGMDPDDQQAFLDDFGPEGARAYYRYQWRKDAAWQDAGARRAALRDARAREVSAGDAASAVVSGDVARYGSGTRVGKAAGPLVSPVSRLWAGLVAAAMLAVGVAAAGLLIPGRSNAATQPTGPVAVQQVGLAVPSQKLEIANGSKVDISYKDATKLTCPKPFALPNFGALYRVTANGQAYNFTPDATSQFAPKLDGVASGASVNAKGSNEIYQLDLTLNFNQLNLPSTAIGTGTITVNNPAGGTCSGTMAATAKVDGASAPAAPPAPKLAGVVAPGSGLSSSGTDGTGGVSWPWPIVVGGLVLLGSSAAVVAGGIPRSQLRVAVQPAPPRLADPPAKPDCDRHRATLAWAEAMLAEALDGLDEYETIQGALGSPEGRRSAGDRAEANAFYKGLRTPAMNKVVRRERAGLMDGEALKRFVERDREVVANARAALERCLAGESADPPGGFNPTPPATGPSDAGDSTNRQEIR